MREDLEGTVERRGMTLTEPAKLLDLTTVNLSALKNGSALGRCLPCARRSIVNRASCSATTRVGRVRDRVQIARREPLQAEWL